MKTPAKFVDQLFERKWDLKLEFPDITPEEVEDEAVNSIATKVKAVVDSKRGEIENRAHREGNPDLAREFFEVIDSLVDCTNIAEFNWQWDAMYDLADKMGIWIEPFM